MLLSPMELLMMPMISIPTIVPPTVPVPPLSAVPPSGKATRFRRGPLYVQSYGVCGTAIPRGDASAPAAASLNGNAVEPAAASAAVVRLTNSRRSDMDRSL